MKITFIRKACLSLLLAVVFAASLPSASFALEPVAAETERQDAITWELSDDGNTLEGNGRVYTYYELPIMSEIVSDRIFDYADTVENHHGHYRVESYVRDSEIVWLESADYLLTTQKGREHLDSFFNGEKQTFRLYNGDSQMTAVDSSLIDELENAAENGAETVTVNVTTFKRWNEYELKACDSDGIIGYGIGSVFKIDGVLYYVDYENLDNGCFDAYGDLSFRKGSLELVRLEGELADRVKKAINNARYVDVEYDFEYSYEYGDSFPHIGIVWYGFICPIGGTVAGIVLANSKKLGKPRRWYILAAVSAAALLLSVIIVATVV